jgi:hypothetical protein
MNLGGEQGCYVLIGLLAKGEVAREGIKTPF